MNPFQRRNALALTLALLAAPAFAASKDDTAFAMQAAQDGMAEVEMGKLAQQKGQSDRVKQFGSRLIADHGKANDQLKSIATGKAIVLPTAVDAKHKQAHAKLAGMSGAEFDRAFKQQMVEDHQKGVALFEKQSKSGEDKDLKEFAAKNLPTLRDHLKLAEAISDK